ncbi:MAG TPA: DUF4249 family protein, partial [Phaeodactylibacter sp.]|nr:DUF4249 family protein [Phaeodactylibacter sp.]
MNKKYLFPKIIAFAFCLSFIACEDVVEVSLDESPPQLVVDAWVNNQLKP